MPKPVPPCLLKEPPFRGKFAPRKFRLTTGNPPVTLIATGVFGIQALIRDFGRGWILRKEVPAQIRVLVDVVCLTDCMPDEFYECSEKVRGPDFTKGPRPGPSPSGEANYSDYVRNQGDNRYFKPADPKYSRYEYDPTNGTISNGDILRFP